MSQTTLIHPDKVRAYLATDYRLGYSPQDVMLTIGDRAEHLAALYAANGVSCGAFLTAYNPCGVLLPDKANGQAHAQLAAQLAQLGLKSIEGSGSEEGSEWPAERSYFALGITLDAAKLIGTHFEQDAIVWVGGDAIPQLILLR